MSELNTRVTSFVLFTLLQVVGSTLLSQQLPQENKGDYIE